MQNFFRAWNNQIWKGSKGQSAGSYQESLDKAARPTDKFGEQSQID